jgi:hypothetical protein
MSTKGNSRINFLNTIGANTRTDHQRVAALKMLVPKAPWSAVAAATAVGPGSKAAASLPHSKALRAFSWFLGAAGGMSDCFVSLVHLRDDMNGAR